MAWPKNKLRWQKAQNQPNKTEITIVTTSQGCWKTAATKHLKSLTHSEISTLLSSNNYCPSLPAAVTTQVTRQIPRKGAGLSATRAHASPRPAATALHHTPPWGRAGSEKAFILRPFPQCSNSSETPGPVLPQLLWSRSVLKSLLPWATRFWSQHFQHLLLMVLCFASHSQADLSAGEITEGPRAWVSSKQPERSEDRAEQDPLRLWTRCAAFPSPRRGEWAGRSRYPRQETTGPWLGGRWSSCWGPGLSPTGSCFLELKLLFWETLRAGSAGRDGRMDKAFGLLSPCVLGRLSHVWLFGTPWTVAHQALLSMGFSRQEYWSGLPCPPPGDLSIPGIKPTSLALAGRFFTLEPPGKPSSYLALQLMQDGAAPLPPRRWWGSRGVQLGEWSLNTGWELSLLGLYSPSPGVHDSEMAQRWLGSMGEIQLSSSSFSPRTVPSWGPPSPCSIQSSLKYCWKRGCDSLWYKKTGDRR